MTWILGPFSGDVISPLYRASGEPVRQQSVAERIQFPGSSTVSIHTFGKIGQVAPMQFVLPVADETAARDAFTRLEALGGQFALLGDASTGDSWKVRIDGTVSPVIRRGATVIGSTAYSHRLEFALNIEVVE
jgi:hypothetical protein